MVHEETEADPKERVHTWDKVAARRVTNGRRKESGENEAFTDSRIADPSWKGSPCFSFSNEPRHAVLSSFVRRAKPSTRDEAGGKQRQEGVEEEILSRLWTPQRGNWRTELMHTKRHARNVIIANLWTQTAWTPTPPPSVDGPCRAPFPSLKLLVLLSRAASCRFVVDTLPWNRWSVYNSSVARLSMQRTLCHLCKCNEGACCYFPANDVQINVASVSGALYLDVNAFRSISIVFILCISTWQILAEIGRYRSTAFALKYLCEIYYDESWETTGRSKWKKIAEKYLHLEVCAIRL